MFLTITLLLSVVRATVDWPEVNSTDHKPVRALGWKLI